MLQSIANSDSVPAVPTRLVDEPPLFREWHPHVLLMGDEASLGPALARLRPRLRGPISQWRPAVATDPPRVTKGALFIWGVDKLNRDQQSHLLAWMTGAGAHVQIISIPERPLFPLVCQTTFLDDLYYRLNMLCVVLNERPAEPRSTLF